MWTVLGVAASLGPALFALLSGRRLARLADDPALPERLAAYRSRLVQLTVAALVVAWFATPDRAPWLSGLTVLSLLVAGFPMRRALFRESWGLAGYLAHLVRATLAGAGFWLLLAATPLLVLAARPHDRPAAVLLAALLLAWELSYARVFLWLVGATPLDRPDLAARFDRALARARTRPPRLFRAGPAGGAWTNAFAFPGLPESQVLFTDTVLSRFDPDELTAILAHEVAHLEHYDRGRLLRLSAITCAAILLAVLLPWLAGAWATTASWVWPLVVLFGLLVRLARHKGHEADSDRRAVALCGDADALVRALVKLHVLMRMPRRWEVDFERGASHPSLAHRIQGIRGAAGEAPPATGTPAGVPSVVPGRTPGAVVIFDADRVHRLEAVPPALVEAPDATPETLRGAARAVQTVTYSELTDLRVRTTLRGTPSLVATDRTGRSWTVPLRADAVAAAQRALDAVDSQLARAPLGLVHQPALGVIAAAAAGLTAVYAAGFWTVAATAVVAVIRPAPAPLAGLGGGAVVAALLALREGTAILPLGVAGVAALGVLGAVTLALALARARGGDASPGPAVVTVGLLVAFALVGGATLLAAAVEAGAIGLARAARSMPGAAVALAGVAAALATLPARRARPAAIAAAALAVIPIGLGSVWFLDRAARDPLLAAVPPIPTRAAPLRLVHETRFGQQLAGLVLDPSGTGYALAARPHGSHGRWGFQVARGAGAARFVAGDDLEFLGDRRLLVLARTPDGPELRLADDAAPEAVVWRRRLPALPVRDLAAEPATGAWRLTAVDPAGDHVSVLTGVAGQDAVRESRWRLPPDGREVALAVGPESALAVRVDWRPPSEGWPAIVSLVVMSLPSRIESEVWLLGAAEARRLVVSRLAVRCLALAVPATPFACLAGDGARTHLWSVDGEGRRTALGILAGGGAALQSAGDDRVLLWQGDEAWLVEPGRRLAARLDLPGPPDEMAYRSGRLGTVSRDREGVTVRLYEVN